MSLPPTPSQTLGPFFSIGLTWEDGPLVVPEDTPGAIRIHGVLYDGAGDPIPDAVVETWQADPDGRFAHPDDPRGEVKWDAFRGLGRSGTDDRGHWSIITLKPGPVPSRDDRMQAPHIDVSVLARGLLQRVVTRIYFSDEEAANATDPVLCSLPPSAPAERLVAVHADDSTYRFDIHLQGERESVFFAV